VLPGIFVRISREIPIPGMTDTTATPLDLTFSILVEAEGARATQLLCAALDVPREVIQLAAARIILQQSSHTNRTELLRRIESLPDSVRQLLSRSAVQLNGTFRQLLLHGNFESHAFTLRAIQLTEQYHQTGNLLELLKRPNHPDLEAVAETLRGLTDRLYDRWQIERDHAGRSVTPTFPQRNEMLLEFDRAIQTWEAYSYRDVIAESILVLAEPSHPTAKRLLWQSSPDCRDHAARLLLESRHPGVMQFLAESLTERYPHPKVFEAIHTRSDPEFLGGLLRVISRRRSNQQIQHLRQLQQLSWLEPPYDLLATIPPNLQPALLTFVNATHVSRETKADVYEWLLRHGSPEGKRAATEGMTPLEDATIQEVVRDNLESEDEGVQAWAVSQVRHQAMPEAFAVLIERLDSPSATVRDAARSELSWFNVVHVLALADELPEEDALRAGVLLMKIDPQAEVNIRRELAHPARQKRIHAARRVAWLGLQHLFTSAYASLIYDTDPLARRTAAEVLKTSSDPAALQILQQLLDDPHPRVRETAEQSIAHWEQRQNVSASTNLHDASTTLQLPEW